MSDKSRKIGIIIFWSIVLLVMIISIVLHEKNRETSEYYIPELSYEITDTYYDELSIYYHIDGIVTNNTDKKYSYIQINFSCYDSDGINLGSAMDNMNNLEANERWKFSAMSLFQSKDIDHCDIKEITKW